MLITNCSVYVTGREMSAMQKPRALHEAVLQLRNGKFQVPVCLISHPKSNSVARCDVLLNVCPLVSTRGWCLRRDVSACVVVVLGAPGRVLDLPVLWTQEVSDQISGAGQMLLEGGEKSQREENPKGENAFWNGMVYNCNNSPSRWFL